MKIRKLKIENLYGIQEFEIGDKSIELTGNNGVGKSSVIDAIRLALTNNSKRKYIVRNGENEGRVYVKLDDGVTIDRKKRTDKSDYKSIKDKNGNEINSPETFLKDIFTPLQLEPVEFLNMSEQEQNRILLNLIDFKEDKAEFIKRNFGELPSWVDYNNSILEILNEIQSKDGGYYQDREEINRNVRNGQAIVNDIAKDIPENYDADKWRNYTLSDKYEELNKMKSHNDKIDRSIAYKENYDNTIKGYKGELDSKLSKIFLRKAQERDSISTKIEELKSQITSYEKDLENLDNKYNVENTKAQSEYNEKVAKLEENIKVANEWASKEKENTDILENELKIAEEMKIPHTTAFHVQPENITYAVGLGEKKYINDKIYTYFRSYFNKFRHIHCPSNFIANQLIEHGYTAKMHVISNGVDDDFIFSRKAKPEELKDKIVITMVGRYSPEKRQDVLIDAIYKSKYSDKIQLILCGQGQCFEKYKELSKNLKNKPIMKFYEKKDLVDVLSYTDIYVHSADAEIEAISCLEAIACGNVPIISNSNESATVQFALNEESLFEHGNSQDLARKIDYFLDNEDHLKEMRKVYAEFANKFRIENSIKLMEEMFREEIGEYEKKENR